MDRLPVLRAGKNISKSQMAGQLCIFPVRLRRMDNLEHIDQAKSAHDRDVLHIYIAECTRLDNVEEGR